MAGGIPKSANSYLGKTHQPLNCLVFILPILAAYEAGALFFPNRLLAPRHLEIVLAHFGASAPFLPAVLVVLALLLWYAFSPERAGISGQAVAGMAAESLLWTAPLIVLGLVANHALAGSTGFKPVPTNTLAQAVLTGVGAGVYEEFIFRLIGVGLVLLLLTEVAHLPKAGSEVLLVLVMAALFSLYHYIGPETFNWQSFAFRSLAGIYLAFVFLARGFGIAVGTHALYNVYIAWNSAAM